MRLRTLFKTPAAIQGSSGFMGFIQRGKERFSEALDEARTTPLGLDLERRAVVPLGFKDKAAIGDQFYDSDECLGPCPRGQR